jgi:hypothetical protein
MSVQDDVIISIVCLVDDFCKEFEPKWRSFLLTHPTPKGDARHKRTSKILMSEIMTIVIYFHRSKFRTFKDYYLLFVTDRINTISHMHLAIAALFD